MEHFLDNFRKPFSGLITLFLLILIFIIGFYVRVDEYRFWDKFPDVFYYDTQPVLANGDGYYYLRITRDLLENHYVPNDELKHYPDNVPRPFPPPLISLLVAVISKYTSLSHQWIAVFLPALIAPLLIIPLYGLCTMFSGRRVMGITASLMAVLSVQYVNRTRIGFFDTDCLNVTLTIFAMYFFMKFALETKRSRYIYFSAGIIVTGFFWLHWDQVRHIALAISLFPLAMSLIFFYRPPKKEGIIFGTLFLFFVILVLSWIGRDTLIILCGNAQDFYIFLTSDVKEYFPATLDDVREMEVPSFQQFINYTSGNILINILSLAGFLLLIYKNGKKNLFIAIPVVLTGLTISLGNRFLIFYAPVAAMGFGFFAEFAWKLKITPSWIIKTAIITVTALCSFSMFHIDTAIRYSPATMNINPGIKKIRELSPHDAVIWSSWDAGSPLMYYTRRKTVSDAQFPKGRERHLYTYQPLAADNSRFSANFIQFFTKNGVSGIHKIFMATGNNPVAGIELIRNILSTDHSNARKILSSALVSREITFFKSITTVDDFLQFFFPRDLPPVFLLLHKDMILSSNNWFRFGSWDMKNRKGHKPVYIPLSIIKIDSDQIYLDRGKLKTAGPEAGIFKLNMSKTQNNLLLSSLLIRSGDDIVTIPFNNESELQIELFSQGSFGAIMDNKIAISAFNKLFIRHEANPAYFRLIAEDIPSYQIWQVFGDSY